MIKTPVKAPAVAARPKSRPKKPVVTKQQVDTHDGDAYSVASGDAKQQKAKRR